MKRLYIETLDKIRASDEAKAETVARMREKLAEKKNSVRSLRKKRLTAVASAVCVVVLWIAVPPGILRAGSRDEPGTVPKRLPISAYIRSGGPIRERNGSSVTFTGIRVENNLP